MKTKNLLLLLPVLLTMVSCNTTPLSSTTAPIGEPTTSGGGNTTSVVPPTTSTGTPSTQPSTPSTTPITGVMTIAQAKAATKGTKITLKATITGDSGRGFYLQDETGFFYAYYKGAATRPNIEVGDVATFSGTKDLYGNIHQLAAGFTAVKVSGEQGATLRTKTITSASELENQESTPVSATAVLNETKTYQSGSDFSVGITIGGVASTIFVYKGNENASQIAEAINKIGVNNSFKIVNGFVDSYTPKTGAKQNQIAITEVAQIKEALPETPEEKLNAAEKYVKSVMPLTATIIHDVKLPTTSYGAAIAWTSSNETLLSNKGVIARPEIGEQNGAVKLSYTISIEGTTETKAGSKDYKVQAKLSDADQKAYNSKFLNEFRTNQPYSFAGSLPTTGESKLHVVPVQFSDKLCSNVLTEGCDVARENIRKSFFGTSSETGWESVSSFYNKSSYGALNIKGEVANWYTAPVSYQEIASTFNNYNATIEDDDEYFEKASAYVSEVTNGLALQYTKDYLASHNQSIDELDSNKDGIIDGIWFVYDVPYVVSPEGDYDPLSELFWAFTTKAAYPETEKNQYLDTFAWASYDFLKEGGYSTVTDAHTFIHETGHMMGFDDYYNYAYDGSSPAGAVAMMDNNIGDHDAYTKYLAGWTLPTEITEAKDYTLRPFESTGDSLVYGYNYNGTAYSEYLIFEYYTPTGVNAKDKMGYPGTGNVGTFSENGLKIYHVDSKLGKVIDDGEYVFWDEESLYTPFDLDPTKDEFEYDILNSNTIDYSYMQESDYVPLLQLMEATGKEDLMGTDKGYADNDDLFQLNDDFGITKFKDFKFHDGSTLEFTFKVTALSDGSLTLTVAKK